MLTSIIFPECFGAQVRHYWARRAVPLLRLCQRRTKCRPDALRRRSMDRAEYQQRV
jgi:hypothetical protein